MKIIVVLFALIVCVCFNTHAFDQSNSSLSSYLSSLSDDLEGMTCLEFKLAGALAILNASLDTSPSLTNIIATRSKQLSKIRSAKSFLQEEIHVIKKYTTSVFIVDNLNGKLYSNNETAESCKEYRYPTNPLRVYNNEGSGYYQITPVSSNQAVKVYCDMESDGGGWTVIGNWIDGASQHVGVAELTTNFWASNHVPRHNQTLVHVFNDNKSYGWIFNYEIPSNSDARQTGHSKALFDATGVNTCTEGYKNEIYYATGGKILVLLCEPMFGVPVVHSCSSGPNALHITNTEYGLPNQYTPPSIAYRCGPASKNIGTKFNILVR